MDSGIDADVDAGAGNRGRRRTGTDRFNGAFFFAKHGAVRIAERGTDCTSNDATDCAANGAAYSITE